MTALPRATRVLRATAAGDETLSLSHEGRFLRRKRLVSDAGRNFLADLPETTDLHEGDALALDDGSRIGIRAAPEPLLEVRGDSLARLAWHIGNRHTPCEIGADALRLRADHVLADMLRGLGAEVTQVTAPFRPEGGAYGMGRTLAHSHGSPENPDSNSDHHH